MKKILLVLLFAFSLFAGESEERGVHYIVQKGGELDSAVLAPDGKSFYTLKDEEITYWQLSPIKYLSSFPVEIKQINGKAFNIRMLLSDDGKRMVLWTKKEIQLFDLETKKLLKKINIESEAGAIVGNTFIILNEDFLITKYDVLDLKIIASKKINCMFSDCNPQNLITQFILGSDKFLFIKTRNELLVIYNENLSFKEEMIAATYLYDSVKKDLYILFHGYEEYNKRKYIINIVTGKTEKLLTLKESYIQGSLPNIFLADKPASPIYEPGFEKPINGLSLHFSRGKAGFFHEKSLSPIARFYQFKDKEWVLMGKKGSEKFMSSKNARKYLHMMKTANISIPINDETFEKYNTQINLMAD